MYKFLSILALSFALSCTSYADRGFVTEVTTLAVAGTAQVLTASVTKAFDYVVQNPSTNVVSVFLGDSDVATSGANLGIELQPGQSVSITSSHNFDDSNRSDQILSSNLWLVSGGTAVPVVIGRITKQ